MTIAILLAWPGNPAHAQSKMVFAHYMVTNQDYQADDPNDNPPGELKIQAYEKEITQAQAAGIDGFALNCGGWSTQTYYITYCTEMFQAAVALNSGFKLMFSADFAPGINQENDVLDMMRRFCNDPAYSSVYFKYNNAFVLSSFSGDQTGYGTAFWQKLRTDLTTGSNPSGTIGGFPSVSSAPMNVLFLPCFFLGGTNPALSEVAVGWQPWTSVVDGLFYWGVVGVAGSGLPQNDQIPCMNYESQVVHSTGKLFMAPVTFQFWSPNNPNGNQYYEAQGYHQMRTMWMNIINSSHPDLVEEPTWNDFIEGSYISPIDDPNKYPNANFLGTTGVPTSQLGYYHSHIGAWALTPYFVSWYKNGTPPTITNDAIYWAYRTQSMNSTGAGPSTGTLNGPVTDSIYVTVNAAAPATLKVTVGGTVTTINVPQGSNDFSVPFTPGVTPAFELDRSGTAVIPQTSGTDQIQTSPQYNDWYYSTGYATGAAFSQAPTSPVNVTATGGGNQVQLAWSPSTGTANITYNVYRGTTAGGESATPIASGITAGWYQPTITYTDTTAVNGTKYYYTIKGVNSLGTSGASTEVSATAAPFVAASAPTNVTANGFDNEVFLGWNASATGAAPITYNVYRGTTAGGESATPIATGVTSTGFVDANLSDGATYYYKIAAVNPAGTGAQSTEVSATTSTAVARIACGSSSAIGSYSADMDFSGGNTFSVNMPIDTSKAIAPAPVNVYENGRWGGSTYTIPGLTAGQTYIVRLHFCESSWFLVGSRIFSVSINGTTYLPNFDIFATGGQLVPVIENIPVAANSSGQIAITFTVGSKDNPEINGIEVLKGGTIPSTPGVPSLAASANNAQVRLSWPAVPNATSYNIYRGFSPGGEGSTPVATVTSAAYSDNFLANGTTYYYKISAVSIAGTSALSNEASATPAATATAPTSPTGLAATGGNAQVSLVWNASTGTGTITYNIYRGTASGAETLLTSGVTSSAYTDTTAANGTKYYYVVSATNSVGTSGNSNEASATPQAPTLGSVPTGVTATAGVGKIALSWNASTGTAPITYNVYRSTTSGGEGTTAYQTGLTGTTFTDTGLAAGATYYYKVAAVNPAGTSAQSAEASAKTLTIVYQIDCGSASAVAPYAADEFFDVGTEYSAGSVSIDTSAVSSPAPQGVYQSVRWNSSFNYTIPGLTAGSSYLVRLHFCELSFTATGSRQFNVAINGASVLSNFDIFAAAGGQYKAVVKEFNATANSSGQIAIAFSKGAADNPEIAGIEIYGGSGTTQTPPSAPSSLSASGGNAQVTLSWPASSGATSYNVYRGTAAGGESTTAIATGVSGTTYTDTSPTNGTTYYYKVAAVNSAGTSGLSPEASATPQTSLPSAPTGLGATAGNAQVSLSWTGSSGATSYNVYRGTAAGGESPTAIATGLTGTSYTDTGLTNGTTYYYTVKAVNSAGTSSASNEANATPAGSTGEAPYGGTPWAIPGTIQAENYDTGGEGVAYHDAEATNLGGQYRTSEGVDIETCSDTGGGYDVGWNMTGEWQKFTVNVASAGTYTVTFRVANGTTANGGFHLQNASGTNLTGAVTVAPTGGWQTWTNATANVTLPAGQQILTLWDDASNYNINYMTFAGQTSVPAAPTGLSASGGNAQVSLSWTASNGATSYNVYRGTSAGGEGTTAIATGITGTTYTNTGLTNGTTYYYKVAAVNSAGTSGMSNEASATPAGSTGEAPYGGTPWAIPGTVQSENYDTGGEGVAYHDTDAANNGGQYRTTEGVDVETTSDTGGGYDVGWNMAGEWQKYTVNVASAGTYTVTFRVANGTTANGSFHLQDASGSNLSGAVTVAPTGGWQTWTNITANVTLPAGQQILTLWDDTGNYNINYMSFATASGGQPDLIVTSISWTPSPIASGNHVVFSCVVKNQGMAATPAGTTIGVQFAVDGVTTPINWSDTDTTSLAPGASVTLTANNGTNGVNYWPATSGSHTVQAWVDDVNRIAESNENNNKLTASFSVP